MSQGGLNNLSFRAQRRNLSRVKLMDSGSLYLPASAAAGQGLDSASSVAEGYHFKTASAAAGQGLDSASSVAEGYHFKTASADAPAPPILRVGLRPSSDGPLPLTWPRVATGFELAPSSTMDASGYEVPAGDWIWDSSDLWHYQIITAHIEPSGEGFVAECREGSAATPLLKWVAWALFVALTAGAAWWLRSGWVVAIGFGLLLLTLWVVLRPAQKNVRRMLRLASRYHL